MSFYENDLPPSGSKMMIQLFHVGQFQHQRGRYCKYMENMAMLGHGSLLETSKILPVNCFLIPIGTYLTCNIAVVKISSNPPFQILTFHMFP